MRGSLRRQVTLLVVVIVCVSLGAAAIAFVRVTRSEMTRLLLHTDAPEDREALEQLGARLRDEGVAGAATWMARTGTRAVVVGGERVVASAEPRLANARVTPVPGGGIRIEASGLALLLGPATAAVRTPDGAELRVFPLPPRGVERLPGEDLVKPLERQAAWLVAAGAGLGILLAIALVRRVTGPLEELTRAARRLEAGDLSVRVETGSRDEVGALGSAFNALATRLERSEAVRRNMVSDVAHELRAPLTNIRCEIESMQDGVRPLDPARIDSVHTEVLALATLIDDLQELAVAEARQLRLETSRFDLTQAVRRVAQLSEAVAARRGVSIDVSGPPTTIDADERRSSQVARNLVSNAIAHSPEGGRVRLAVSADERNVRVAVTDSGTGVTATERDRVFERFHRSDPSRTRASGGTGLGLAIAKAIVEAHGGRIGVDAAETGGACFWFELPRS